jgi:hypothetical protein
MIGARFSTRCRSRQTSFPRPARDSSGVWQLESQPSLNGIWVKVDAVTVTDNCFFQCGEQRFGFRL